MSRAPAFLEEADPALRARFSGARVICFGHLGDGNLHYNAFVPGRSRNDAAARGFMQTLGEAVTAKLTPEILNRIDNIFIGEKEEEED